MFRSVFAAVAALAFLAGNATAAPVTLDDFTSPGAPFQQLNVPASGAANPVIAANSPLTATGLTGLFIGSQRTIALQRTGGVNAVDFLVNPLDSVVGPPSDTGRLILDNGSGVSSEGVLSYDYAGQGFSPATFTGSIDLENVTSDIGSVKFTLSLLGTAFSQSQTFLAGLSNQTVSFNLGGSVSGVTGLSLKIESSAAVDVSLGKLTASQPPEFVTPPGVPEPATMATFALIAGFGGLAARRKLKKNVVA